MAKQLVGQAKFQVPGGAATPAPLSVRRSVSSVLIWGSLCLSLTSVLASITVFRFRLW